VTHHEADQGIHALDIELDWLAILERKFQNFRNFGRFGWGRKKALRPKNRVNLGSAPKRAAKQPTNPLNPKS
jgi:hypothetical protein